MANRILLDNQRLSISLPGYDVLTTSISNMIFDSRYGEFSGVIMTGTTSGANVTIPFGRTLPRVPVVWVATDRGGGVYTQQGIEVSTANTNSNGGITAYATNSEMKISNTYSGTIRYIVFSVGAT